MIQLIFSHLGTLDILIVFVALIFPVVLCAIRAKKLNRSTVIWGILGLILSFIAVLVIYVLPKSEEK